MRCFYGRTEITQHCLTACLARLKDESFSLVCLDFIGLGSSPRLVRYTVHRPMARVVLNFVLLWFIWVRPTLYFASRHGAGSAAPRAPRPAVMIHAYERTAEVKSCAGWEAADLALL